ncbi:recombinase family protein [Colwellia psychrerythraea]|uniref:Resolvase domain-containing protein n=1 Tax=Colwellia psychrerythraea TaxID=28229 RepID=A0A099L626_COLPS|nr:recombinase family protein [Colwellia psychrerythraea]KGJ97577.1 Resolvase domain-containing protein [Colwellia psychrerythraea]
MKFIYSRVSTLEQNVEQQTQVLVKEYADHDQVFEDKFSGKDLDRPALQELLGKVRKNDTVIAYDVSRLGRNTVDVLTLVEKLQEQGVKVIIHTLGGVDITSSTGKMVLTTMASIAEMQRTEMLEKQKIGIARAQEEGKFKGKQTSQVTVDKFNKINELIASNGLSVTDALKTAGLSKAQYYRMKAK